MNAVSKSIEMLGTTMRDRVTGFTGMVSSISFDAYGCIQAWLTPEAKDDKLADSSWFDVKRLEAKGAKRRMPAPDFNRAFGEENGPAEKGPPNV